MPAQSTASFQAARRLKSRVARNSHPVYGSSQVKRIDSLGKCAAARLGRPRRRRRERRSPLAGPGAPGEAQDALAGPDQAQLLAGDALDDGRIVLELGDRPGQALVLGLE